MLLFSLFLWGLCGFPRTLSLTREYYFIDEVKTWPEAQRYCRDHYTDLATVSSLEEAARLKGRGHRTGQAWIGLYDDPESWKGEMTDDSNSWRWSATGTTSPGGYQNWADDAPSRRHLINKCVLLRFDGVWMDSNCSSPLPFVCCTGTGAEKTLYVVETFFSWEDAVAHCRANHSELAMIQSPAENSEVTSLVDSLSLAFAWIGLYREPWRWSDNTTVHFTNWKSVGLVITNRHCAAEEASDHRWIPLFCGAPLPFFCYTEVKKSSTVVQMEFSSGLDLSDPRNNQMILKKIQEQLDKAGHAGVKVTWKTPPKKKTKRLNTEL